MLDPDLAHLGCGGHHARAATKELLIKSGGGTRPLKPRQPTGVEHRQGAKSGQVLLRDKGLPSRPFRAGRVFSYPVPVPCRAPMGTDDPARQSARRGSASGVGSPRARCSSTAAWGTLLL